MPLYNAYAIVLRRFNFGETDRIVTLYTRERGKVSGIAKGARKPVSRLAGATEVLTFGKFQLANGRTLDVISQIDVKGSFPQIRADLHKSAHSMYLVELLDRFIEEQEANHDIFDLLLSALYLMERPNDPELITRMFELQFMTIVGYKPTLDRCLRCRTLTDSSDTSYQFSPSLGGLVCRNCGHLPEDAIPISQKALETMKSLQTAEAPDVERMTVTQTDMDQITRVMRWYIRYRAERELKSMEFLQTLKSTHPS